MRCALILVASLAIVSGRVSFGSTEVIDDVDLRGRNTVSFTCDGGCRVYSPTRNDQIVIVDNTGKELTSLSKLANLKDGEVFELEAKIVIYHLQNKGAADPSFVFYIVENQGNNYATPVVYLPASGKLSIDAQSHARTTILAAGDAVHVAGFIGDYTGALPSVYATGIDGVTTSTCRPVYTARSSESLQSTYFTVYGPIATIDFGKTGAGISVLVSDDLYPTTSIGKEGSAVYMSPGYVGCDTTGTALYTRVSPAIKSIDSAFTVSDPNGLSVSVNGDYSIQTGGDALTLTVGNDVQKLYGKQSIEQTYSGTSLTVGVAWAKKAGSADRFALQIDTVKNGPEA